MRGARSPGEPAGDPLFGEFPLVSMEIIEVRGTGLRHDDRRLNFDYRDWLALHMHIGPVWVDSPAPSR